MTSNGTVDLVQYAQHQEKVVSLYAAGQTVSNIMKLTGHPRKYVEQLLADFRQYAAQDRVIQERAREIVLVVDQHYRDLVRDLHKAVEDANENLDYKAAMTGLKALADVEAKRVELVQKAGIIAEDGIGDQIAESERKQRIIVDILQNGLCSNCRSKVAHKLSQVSGEIEPTVVVQ